MRKPTSHINRIIANLGREPTALEQMIIDQVARLQVEVEKAEAMYDRQQPIIVQTGSKGQMKHTLNPLSEYLSISRSRIAKMLHYLDKHSPQQPEETELLKDIMDL